MNEEDAEVDLSSLENFSLSPDWSSSKKPNFPQRNERFLDPKNKDSRNRPKGGQPRKKANYAKRNTDFDLGWSFSIIPDVKILQTIKLKLKETGITYSLREITDVIASKNERLMVKIASKNPENQIWKSKTSDSYFISRESAVNNFFSEEKTFIECKLLISPWIILIEWGKLISWDFNCPEYELDFKYIDPTRRDLLFTNRSV